MHLPLRNGPPRRSLRPGLLVATLAAGLGSIVPAAPEAHAATYYVDGQCATCTVAGPGTESQPYKTIASALAVRKGPGVTIVVKPGVYREQVTINESGTAAEPFVLRAAGPGVVLEGTDDFSAEALWTPMAPTPVAGSQAPIATDAAWLAAGINWSPKQVFVDGRRLVRSSASPALLPAGAFTWVAGEGLYLNLAGENPGRHEVLVGRRSSGVRVGGRSWVTIEGFEIRRADDNAIDLFTGCSDLRVAGNVITEAYDYGIKTAGGVRILVEGNRVSGSTGHGIGLASGSTGCIVRNNEAFRNAQPNVRAAKGIYLQASPQNVIVGNRTYENQDSGIQINAGSHYCLVYNNRSWNNGDHGFDHLDATGTSHVHNVAWGNFKDGFSIEGNSPGTQLFNCIAADNGLTTDRFNLWVNAASAVGFRSDYNVFWNSNGQAPVKFITTKYKFLADYQSATGLDLHSLQSNPQLGNPRRGDFVPMSGSPVIDAGTSELPYWPAEDGEGHVRFDDPMTVDAGAGDITYADIGALEFVGPVEEAPTQLPPPHDTIGDRPLGAFDRTAAGGTGELSLSGAFPNPSRDGVGFAIDLPRDSRVEWAVYDLQGRTVWSESRALPAGRNELRWGGTDDAGGPAATGVYLVRARVEGRQFVRRVIRF